MKHQKMNRLRVTHQIDEIFHKLNIKEIKQGSNRTLNALGIYP
jgi:hypothetical protein